MKILNSTYLSPRLKLIGNVVPKGEIQHKMFFGRDAHDKYSAPCLLTIRKTMVNRLLR